MYVPCLWELYYCVCVSLAMRRVECVKCVEGVWWSCWCIARGYVSAGVLLELASSWFSSLRLYNDARTNIHQIYTVLVYTFFCWNLTWFTIIGHLQGTTQTLFERTQDFLFFKVQWKQKKTVCCDIICKYSLLRFTVKIKWYHKFKFNLVSIYVIQFLLLRHSVDSVIDKCEDDKIYKTGIFHSIVVCWSSI